MKGNWDNFRAVWNKYMRKEDIFKLPNILCYFRMLLVVVFVILYITPITIANNPLAGVYLSVGVMVLAAYTDFLDGFIARTFDQKSNLGKVVDPLADKILQLGILVALVVRYRNFPALFVMLGMFLVKEFTLFWEDFFLARLNRSYNGAKWYGKLSTFLFYVITATLLLGGPFVLNTYAPFSDPNNFRICHLFFDIPCLIATAFLFLAWVLYLIKFFLIAKHGQNEVELIPPKEDHHD